MNTLSSTARMSQRAQMLLQAGKLCDKNFVVCARGVVNNETLYRLKNEAAVQGIVLEGVLVYEL